MSKLRDSLKKLIGRIKEYMDAVFMTIGGVLVPLGFTLLFYSIQSGKSDLESYGLISALLGLLCWILSFWFAREKDRKSDQDKAIQTKLLFKIYEEIHNLREAFNRRGGQNGEHQGNSAKPKSDGN
jgi:hypothetical protein